MIFRRHVHYYIACHIIRIPLDLVKNMNVNTGHVGYIGPSNEYLCISEKNFFKIFCSRVLRIYIWLVGPGSGC